MRQSLSYSAFRFLVSVFFAISLTGCAIATQPQRPSPQKPSPTATAAEQQPTSDAIDRPTSKPYTGDLSRFEDPKRDQNLQVNRVMDILGIKQGSNVADIGAGSGWFTVRAARRVETAGVVYAVEINPDYLKHIEARAEREKLPNIKTILGQEDDPRLPNQSVDAVLLLKTYHEVAQPIRLLKRTREAMRTGALLGIIDREGEDDDHGIEKEIVIKEASSAGFTLVDEYDFVKPDNVDYFLVFRAK